MFLIKAHIYSRKAGCIELSGCTETGGRLVLGSLVRCRLGVRSGKGERGDWPISINSFLSFPSLLALYSEPEA